VCVCVCVCERERERRRLGLAQHHDQVFVRLRDESESVSAWMLV
jgi:hypothetical protein